MSPYKKRILVGGILAICVSAAIYSLVEDETPSVAWMFVISAIWAGLAYLLPDSFFIRMKALLNWRLWLKLAAVGIGILAVIFTGAVITQIVKRDVDTPNPSEKAPKILENDALRLVQGLDQMTDEQRAAALDIIKRYKQQQDDAGEPLFPSVERARVEREKSLRLMFESPEKIDYDPGYTSADPMHDKMQYANMAFLSWRCQKEPREVSARYDSLLSEYAQLHFGATGKVDTATFYSLVQKHYGNHKADASATQGLPIHIGPPSSLPREP